MIERQRPDIVLGRFIRRSAVGVFLLAAACQPGAVDQPPESQPPAATFGEAPEIDLRSYRLGGIGSFAEMVAAGVKTLALSAAVTPSEMDAIVDEAGRVADRNGALIHREADFLVTDLFPAELTEGKEVLLIYNGDTRERYEALKAEKAGLIERGAYEGEARERIARSMGELLSYPDWKIDELLAAGGGDR